MANGRASRVYGRVVEAGERLGGAGREERDEGEGGGEQIEGFRKWDRLVLIGSYTAEYR